MTPEITKFLTIIQHLAKGIDPDTSEPLTTPSVFERSDVIRALYEAARALEVQDARARNSKRLRAVHAGKRWTPDEEQRLLEQFDAGTALAEIAKHLDRTPAGIIARLQRHNRMEGASWRISGRVRRG